MDQLNIEFLRITELMKEYDSNKLFIEHDGHPTELLNNLIANKILVTLKKKNLEL
jgi:hypothetical protein